jgi:superfamily II DNA or RNA helicase
MTITLFPDQQEALDRTLAEYKAQPVGGKALVVAPTAWGKTVFFSFLAQALKSVNILIIAHRDELLNQAREKLQMVEPTAIVGKVGSGVYEWDTPITVAGIDTISQERHLKNLHKFNYGLVITDECHHFPAPKYQKVKHALPDAFWLGVTATDDRLDNKSLFPHFGAPVFRMTIVEAIEKQRLCSLKVHAVQTDVELDTIGSSKNADGETDFNEKELANAIDTPARNSLIVRKYQEYASGERAVAFCVTVKHAKHLAETFNNAGIPAALISGDTTIPERQRIFTAYRAGDIKVLTNVQVLTEGWDEPLAKVCIMARPTQSRALYTQCCGRVLRKAPGKQYGLILDITDNCFRLRLSLQSVHRITGVKIRDGETIEEALKREAAGNTDEKEAVVRKLKEGHKRDMELNILAFEKLEWQERPGGLFVLEIGLEKHRIALAPCKGSEGLYDVFARLAPRYDGQIWLKGQPLDWALQEAEKRAKMLLVDSKSVTLVDRNAPWRSKPIDPNSNQVKTLKWYRIPWTPEMTKGEASDLIDAHKQKIEQRKAKAAAKKAQEVGA